MKPFNGSTDLDGETLDFTLYQGEKFFVTVTRYRQAYVFDMEKDPGRCTISQPAPLWVKPLEIKLGDIISRNIRSSL